MGLYEAVLYHTYYIKHVDMFDINPKTELYRHQRRLELPRSWKWISKIDKRNTEKVDEASLGEQYFPFPRSDQPFC